METVTKVANEAILNIRTVASLRKTKKYIRFFLDHIFLGQEPHIYSRYCKEMNKLEKIMLKMMSLRGLVNSLGQSIPYFGYALSLYYGATLVANDGVHFKNMIK